MSNAVNENPADWRSFGTKFPIAACRMKKEDFAALYRLVQSRQAGYRDRVVAMQTQQETETPETFEVRKKRVHDAYVTSVTIAMRSGERLTGNDQSIFDAVNDWADVRAVYVSTTSVPNAVLQINPQDGLVVYLDFSQPPAFNFSVQPALATVNESNFEINARSEEWFVATKARLQEFFQKRKTGYDWIHAAGVYDILLLVVGFPLSIWGTVRIGDIFPRLEKIIGFPRVLIYAYVFIFSLTAFRVIFSYARWVCPKVEIAIEGRTNPLRHRAVWVLTCSSIFWPAFYDFVKAALSGMK